MRFAFTEEQEELRKGARRFLAAASSSERVRAAMKSDLGFERDVWTRAAQELGWTCLTIPEAYGGAGFTQVELVGVMEEMGRALSCGPFFSTVCLGANALLAGASDAQKARWLPQIAAGETTATLAFLERADGEDPARVTATAR